MENNIHNQEQPVENRIDKNEDEIDLIEIAIKLLEKPQVYYKSYSTLAILGFFCAIFTPNVYTASCTMVPQSGEKKSEEV